MIKQEIQEKFGFKYGRNGAHSSRTMMLAELTVLFERHSSNATAQEYQQDIEQYNALNKPSMKARQLTWRHLVDLYGMNTDIPLFRIFRLLWESDEEARPLLACQMALARDPLLRASLSTILELNIGETLSRQQMEDAFNEQFPDRYSPAMLKSLAQNVNGTWTNAGYLSGRVKKTRSEPKIKAVNIVFAIILGRVQGATGNRLFTSTWTQMLQCRTEKLLELARLAGHMGLISFKHSSEVIDVGLSGLLSREEENWLNE